MTIYSSKRTEICLQGLWRSKPVHATFPHETRLPSVTWCDIAEICSKISSKDSVWRSFRDKQLRCSCSYPPKQTHNGYLRSICHSIGVRAQRAIECWYSGWISQRTALKKEQNHRDAEALAWAAERWREAKETTERGDERAANWARSESLLLWIMSLTKEPLQTLTSLKPECHLNKASNGNL